eukprot:jgi/Tetstr1/454003/TSEL_040922.t1
MEVYVLLGLVSLGYMFTKKTMGAAGAHAPPRVSARTEELPMHRRYGPQQTIEDVRTREMLRAQDAERAARYPMQTGAVDPRARAYTRNPLDSGVPDAGDTVRSDLAGVDFDAADFRHNNMQPFFGSHVRDGALGDNGALMERFSGAPGPGNSAPKREVPPMFSPMDGVDAANVYGNQSFSDAMQARFDDMNMVNRVKNNELPFEQVNVGPGVGQGYTSAGTGGFGQNQDRDFAMARYKDVDEIRPGNKPKANLEGRLNAGAAPSGSRGMIGQASKNRPYTSFDIEEFGLVATRGAGADAARVRTDPLHGKRLRDPPSAFRVEAAGAAGGTGGHTLPLTPDQASKVGAPKLRQETPMLTGAGRAGIGNAGVEGAHRAFNPLGENERTLSQAMWSSQGGGGCAGSDAVLRAGPPGAVHVPGHDVREHFEGGLRLSGREHTSDAADSHMFGVMAPQAPARGPAYDPVEHRPRTTLKETQIHDARLGNYKNEQGQVGDEGRTTRRTVREGFCDTYDTYGVRNPQPWMVHEGVGAPRADPREHDFPTTTKEITAEQAHPVGGVASAGGGSVAPGAYDVTAAAHEEPRLTSRQFTEQTHYYGPGGRPDQTAYGVVDGNMRDTMHTSGGRTDFQYFGIPRHKNDKGVDYEAVYASTLNDAKQALLRGRQPGGHGAGPKRMPTEHTQGEVFARTNAPYVTDYLPAAESLPKERGTVGSVAFHNNTGLHHSDRIDDQLLSYLNTNPLVIHPTVKKHAASVM